MQLPGISELTQLSMHHSRSESVDIAAWRRVCRTVGSLVVVPESRVWGRAQKPLGLGKKVGWAGCPLRAKGFALCPMCPRSHRRLLRKTVAGGELGFGRLGLVCVTHGSGPQLAEFQRPVFLVCM